MRERIMAKKKENTKKEEKINWLLEEQIEEPVVKPSDEKLIVLKTILEQNKKMIELLEKIVERLGG